MQSATPKWVGSVRNTVIPPPIWGAFGHRGILKTASIRLKLRKLSAPPRERLQAGKPHEWKQVPRGESAHVPFLPRFPAVHGTQGGGWTRD